MLHNREKKYQGCPGELFTALNICKTRVT
jgi:hypothetical protein